MTYVNIEGVCRGNNGRSRIFKAVAQAFVNKYELQDQVRISSSGTQVDEIEALDWPDLVEMLREHVDRAIELKVLDKEDLPILKKSPRAILDSLLVYETRMRNKYLESRGLSPDHDRSVQTVIRPEAKLILPVSKGNLERVQGIYKRVEVDNRPKIELLGVFANVGFYDGEDDWLKPYDQFRESVDRLKEATECAMARAMSRS